MSALNYAVSKSGIGTLELSDATRSAILSSVGKISIILLFSLAGPNAHTVLYILLTIWALTTPKHAIEALSLSFVASFLNPGLYTLSPMTDVLRWAVMAATCGTMFLRLLLNGFVFPLRLSWIWVFTIVATITSLIASYAVDVSLFKLGSFCLAIFSVLYGFYLTRAESAYWETWFLSISTVVIIFSFPLLLFPVGYFRNGSGFQGLLNQPQAFGAFVAPVVAYLASKLLQGVQQHRMPLILLLSVSVISLVATLSRTAVLATVGALVLSWSIATSKKTYQKRFSRLAVRSIPVFLLVLGAVLYNSDTVVTRFSKFTFKNSSASSVNQAFFASRGFLIERALGSFEQNPVFGIGFGVASDSRDLTVERDPIFNLPVGASIEKGFLLFAILEEVGMLGFLFFALMLISVVTPVVAHRGHMEAMALCFAALFINFGESVLLSPGGLGMWIWLLIGTAQVLSMAKDSTTPAAPLRPETA